MLQSLHCLTCHSVRQPLRTSGRCCSYVLIRSWSQRRMDRDRREQVWVRRKEVGKSADCRLETTFYICRFRWRRGSRKFERHVADSCPTARSNVSYTQKSELNIQVETNLQNLGPIGVKACMCNICRQRSVWWIGTRWFSYLYLQMKPRAYHFGSSDIFSNVELDILLKIFIFFMHLRQVLLNLYI